MRWHRRDFSGASWLALWAVLVFAASIPLSMPAGAQSFAVGAGGYAVNDTGTAANLSGFQNWGGFAFGELRMDVNLLLQARLQRFTMPGTAPGAPNIRTWAGNVTVGYLFQEDWWSAGIIGGAGIYALSPDAPKEGQVAADPSETVVGWHGGLLTVFSVGTRWDLRLEATGHIIRSTVPHYPIMLTGAFAYRF